MNNKSDINKEMQEVSAYPTKQEMHQKDVALFEEEAGDATAHNQANTESGQR